MFSKSTLACKVLWLNSASGVAFGDQALHSDFIFFKKRFVSGVTAC